MRRPRRFLHDPPELARLVVGELPGASDELGLCHWGAFIILAWEVLGDELRRVGQLVIRDDVGGAGLNDEELIPSHFNE